MDVRTDEHHTASRIWASGSRLLPYALAAGELVAFPTETVYGLGADAANAEALARVFRLKGRPSDHPLIVHLARAALLGDWAADVPETAWRLAETFWPGPLTLILKRQPWVLDALTGAQDTIGLRVPAHPLALALLTRFGGGVAAPSANRFGHISPTTAAHVRAEFGDAVPVLDGGACAVGLESTILDLSGEVPRVLRPGAVSKAALGGGSQNACRVRACPGVTARFRQPDAPLRADDPDFFARRRVNCSPTGGRGSRSLRDDLRGEHAHTA